MKFIKKTVIILLFALSLIIKVHINIRIDTEWIINFRIDT